jgi:hypothetical protein
MSISYEQIKLLSTKIVADLNKNKEPLDEMLSVVKLVEQVLSREVAFQDKKASQFFYDEFLGSISKAALNEGSFKNKEVSHSLKV